MSDFKELTEKELEEVSGGVNWQAFGQAVLGTVDPAKYPELIAAIASQNWIQVAILAIPLIAKGDADLVKCFKVAS